MIDSDFTEIFAELVGEHDAEQDLLEALAALLPGSGLLFRTEAGVRLQAGAPLPLEPATEQELVHLAHKAGETGSLPEVSGLKPPFSPPVARRLDPGWVYALVLKDFAGVLFCRVPVAVDLSRDPAGSALLVNTLLYALDEQQRQEAVAQGNQYRRQIEVLKQQHGRLIEDNYRQYRINREKEQEYSRKLESEIARQTAELREANVRLAESSRLKSEFLANMSHELRTPMNAIIGFAELLAETSLDEAQAEYCRTIRQSSAALLALINDILDLAKIEAGRLDLEIVDFELDELLESIRAMFALSAGGKGIDLQVRRDSRLPGKLRGDSHRLRQVLINLVGNAVKFTEEGGVELLLEEAAPVGESSSSAAAVRVRFVIRDSGIGIPAHRLGAIFEKFTQADGSTTRRFGGTGLGLAICRQLVELMGGRIEVESHEGRGSVFSFELSLPLAEEQPAAPAVTACGGQRVSGHGVPQVAASETTKRTSVRESARSPQDVVPRDCLPPAGGVRRVLVVEDNPVNQRLASLMIGKQGCEPVVAADGLEALERLRAESFDLVLMDIQMPRLDGLAATREIRTIEADADRRREYAALAERRAPLPIVGLTAHARREDEEACYAAGMNAFLSKPIVREKLVAILTSPVATT